MQAKFEGSAKKYEKTTTVQSKVWYPITPEHLNFIAPYIDASNSLVSLINVFKYENNMATEQDPKKIWHSLSLKYQERIVGAGAFQGYDKTYFDCEWWLNIGLATAKKSCQKYCRPFGGDDWATFLKVFNLGPYLSEVEVEDEALAEDEEHWLKELEYIKKSQEIYKLKEEQIKRKLKLEAPTPQKKFKTSGGSALKRAVETATIRGDFRETPLILENSADNLFETEDEKKKLFKDKKLNPKMERFFERNAEDEEEEKNKIFEQKMKKMIEMERLKWESEKKVVVNKTAPAEEKDHFAEEEDNGEK
jgi:hypothetical protein